MLRAHLRTVNLLFLFVAAIAETKGTGVDSFPRIYQLRYLLMLLPSGFLGDLVLRQWLVVV